MSGGYLLGFDVGSSSIKASVIDSDTGALIGSATSPKKEMEITALNPGWAEQDPDTWWKHMTLACAEIKSKGINLENVKAIGISYQMHGLVIIDKNFKPLRNSIIWCDSRAVEIGNEAFKKIGEKDCLERHLNSPGNFTASKLAWVKKHEPEIFQKTYKMMLPGDYLAYRMTGNLCTTASGLSEGILWDYAAHDVSKTILDHYGFSKDLLPKLTDTFSVQGEVTSQAAQELGVKPGTPLSYRAGDQPNNALSLNVLNPGEIAATAGTSGVVYGIGEKATYDPQSRVNTFVHVNNSLHNPRYGILLCLNGCGICNSWIKHQLTTVHDTTLSYPEMNDLGMTVAPGADGLLIYPYGNGSERTLGNKFPGGSIQNLSFTRHTRAHIMRASQEGIVYALNYGLQIMRSMGTKIDTVRAGKANMFLSPLFAKTFAAVTQSVVELYETDGAQGAARGAGIGASLYKNEKEAFGTLKALSKIEPDTKEISIYKELYSIWERQLIKNLA